MTTPGHDDVKHALQEGAERSRAVAEHPVPEARHVVLWRRHKWKILGLLFVLLTELCLLLLGKSLAMGPG